MSDDHIDKTVALAMGRLREQEEAVLQTKKLINQLLAFSGKPAVFQEVLPAATSSTLQGDEYFGQKQSSAARLVLERRKSLGEGPATLDEIYGTLKQGGYRSEARDDEMAKRSLYNTLTQNSGIFAKLPSGKIGLTAWYPNAPKKRRKGEAAEEAEAPDHDITLLASGDVPEEQGEEGAP